MRKSYCAATVLLAAVGFVFSAARADDAEDKPPKHTIKEVMKKAHKDGLMKKLAIGEGTKEEAQELLELYEALGQNKPPKGEPGSWQEKTGELVAAAQEVVNGKDGAGNRLRKAADCMGCHKMHKGK